MRTPKPLTGPFDNGQDVGSCALVGGRIVRTPMDAFEIISEQRKEIDRLMGGASEQRKEIDRLRVKVDLLKKKKK